MCVHCGTGADDLIILVDRRVRPLVILGQLDFATLNAVLVNLGQTQLWVLFQGSVLPELKLFVVLEHFCEFHVVRKVLFRNMTLLGHT